MKYGTTLSENELFTVINKNLIHKKDGTVTRHTERHIDLTSNLQHGEGRDSALTIRRCAHVCPGVLRLHRQDGQNVVLDPSVSGEVSFQLEERSGVISLPFYIGLRMGF